MLALACTLNVAGLANAEMLIDLPVHLATVAEVQSRGLCLISGCANFASMASLQQDEARQLLSWRTDPRPWARALSWLCNSDGLCAMQNGLADTKTTATAYTLARVVKANLIVRLPLTQLAIALKDPAAQVRAAALLRLDLNSAGARAAAEALLTDAAWVAPLPHTVADHAYFALNAAAPKHYSTRANAALNQTQGIDGWAALRMPYATQAADWQAKVASYPNASGVNVADHENVTSEWMDPPTLAGFWHKASGQQLEAGLAHRDPTIRLTAFDALLVREHRKDSGALAIRAFQRGGTRNIGGCIPQSQSIALAIFTAILQSGQLDQATQFLDALAIPAKTTGLKLLGDPLEDISNYLTSHPSDAALFAPTLRRWVQADSRKAIAALSAAGLSADLPRLQAVADAGDFAQLLGRDDAPIYQAAKAYYQARRSVVSTQDGTTRNSKIKVPIAGQWFRYVYSLPDAKAAALFAEIFSDLTPAAARTNQLRTLYQSLEYETPRIAIDTQLWKQHQVLLPRQAGAILAEDPKAPETAVRLLSSSTWQSQISDPETMQKANYCSNYAEVMAPLMRQLPAKAQEKYLMHALNNEPVCAIDAYLRAATVKPAAALQVLRARSAREQGALRNQVDRAVQTVKLLWPAVSND